MLKAEYASREAGHEQSLAEFIVNPGDRWTHDASNGMEFAQSLTAWEATIEDYEFLTGERYPLRLRTSTLLRHTP